MGRCVDRKEKNLTASAELLTTAFFETYLLPWKRKECVSIQRVGLLLWTVIHSFHSFFPNNMESSREDIVQETTSLRVYAMMRKIHHSFYRRDAETVARELIGAIVVHRRKGRSYRARIVETEAYVGPHDLASHSSKGRTKRTEVMFGPAGCAYVYLIYGMYEMFNIVAGETGSGQAVLIRAAEPLDDWDADLSGPGKLTRALGITRVMNGLELTGNRLYLVRNSHYRPRVRRAKRIGVEYAGKWKHRLLRYFDGSSEAVTYRPRS
jgi:DNA-3-methyladenine glycosylase